MSDDGYLRDDEVRVDGFIWSMREPEEDYPCEADGCERLVDVNLLAWDGETAMGKCLCEAHFDQWKAGKP